MDIGGTYVRTFNVLLVDPLVDSARVRNGSVLLAEPKSNLSLGRLDRVRAMADVATDVNAEVAADRARSRGEGVRGTKERTALLHDILALPDHSHDRTRRHVLDQTWEKWLALKVLVMLLKVVFTSVHQLHGHKLIATILKTLDDLTDQTALDAVRLDHDVRLFVRHVGQKRVGKKGMAWKVGIGFRWANMQPPRT